MQAISQPLSHENGNFSTLPVRHYTVRANGKAESAVKIAKNLVKKAKRENKDL